MPREATSSHRRAFSESHHPPDAACATILTVISSNLFSSPAIRLNTGERFSQLLDQKLGMDPRTSSTSFQQAPPMGTRTSAPPHQTSHLIPQSLPYSSYMPSPVHGQQQQPQSVYSSSAQQSWDRLAIESNLQDYNQVQISPDLVAPIPPPSYFGFGNDRMGGSTEYLGGMSSMSVASGSRPPQQHQQQHQQQQQQQLPQHQSIPSPFTDYQTSTGYMSAPPFHGQQMSPHSHSHSMSSRSSPSNLATTQPGTPQVPIQPIPVSTDMIWQSPFTPVQRTSTPVIPLPRHAQSQPLLRHPSSDTNTPYTPFPNMTIQGNVLTASPAGLGHLDIPSATPMMSHPQSQSYPGPNRWPGEMIHSSSAPGNNQNQNLGRPINHSAPIPSFSQPLVRSASQTQPTSQWTPERPLGQGPFRIDQIPTAFPPAPTLSKRSRSPHSQNSSPPNPNPNQHSHSHSHSHSSIEVSSAPGLASGSKAGSKRPKLSVSMSMTVDNPHTSSTHPSAHPHPTAPSSQGHSEDDNDKKPIIACHTCRARKLK